jgi:hypothetical protein
MTAAKTAVVVSFRSGRTVTPGHVAILAEVLSRDGCRCGFCKAPGGATVQYGDIAGRNCYVVLDTLEAFDTVTGQALCSVPADAVRLGTSSRIVLDVAYLDHDLSNVGRRGRRRNVVALCQVCARRHEDDALFRRWAR